MLSSIDLTEHRDFTDFENMFNIDLPIGEKFRGEALSLEEHEKYIESVKKFGKKYHTDQSHYAFNKNIFKNIGKCRRCGKLVPPWSQSDISNMFMCPKCRKDKEARLPWIKDNERMATNGRVIRDLFTLR